MYETNEITHKIQKNIQESESNVSQHSLDGQEAS